MNALSSAGLPRRPKGLPTKLKDRVALVTGAASGIARATAQRFAREGAKVIVADGIQADGGSASFIPVDVPRAEQVNRMVDAILNQQGQIDVLFNGAAREGLAQ
jgi:NAD(P)-dependent dehydrogenase (short-subunit alcohol dehydrogenase family)